MSSSKRPASASAKVSLISDWQNAGRLVVRDSMDAPSIYRGLAALSNNGVRRSEEAELPAAAAKLLHVRRAMKKGDLSEARETLASKSLSEAPANWKFLEGDRLFLLSMTEQRLGATESAKALMRQSANTFQKIGDLYRQFRASINLEALGYTWEALSSRTIRQIGHSSTDAGAFDLSASLAKARALQLLNDGKFEQAIEESLLSVSLYERDGCPEDASVARIIQALSLLNLGRIDSALSAYALATIRDGKVQHFSDAFEQLLSGRSPATQPGDPLFGTPWVVSRIRVDSPHARILAALTSGAKTRDELIRAGWGDTVKVISENHYNRLSVALHHLRKRENYRIQFVDGKYVLRLEEAS